MNLFFFIFLVSTSRVFKTKRNPREVEETKCVKMKLGDSVPGDGSSCPAEIKRGWKDTCYLPPPSQKKKKKAARLRRCSRGCSSHKLKPRYRRKISGNGGCLRRLSRHAWRFDQRLHSVKADFTVGGLGWILPLASALLSAHTMPCPDSCCNMQHYRRVRCTFFPFFLSAFLRRRELRVLKSDKDIQERL